MEPTIIDRLHSEFATLVEVLKAASEPSLQITADECFRKTLLLTAASLFETAVVTSIQKFVEECSAGNMRVVELVRRKALERQYHSLFSWNESHAHQFFALFGTEFKTAMADRAKNDESFSSSIAAFMELGRERNRLVHQNFGHFSLEKTADEIYDLYKKATVFVDQLPRLLRSA
jgi:hypothetical protein